MLHRLVKINRLVKSIAVWKKKTSANFYVAFVQSHRRFLLTITGFEVLAQSNNVSISKLLKLLTNLTHKIRGMDLQQRIKTS